MGANEQQLQAINSDADRILVMAGAGAGKTFVMIQRVTRLVEAGVDPRTILVLTFTNNAAFEMRERYKKQNPGTIIPEFRTFHSFCYSLIVKDTWVREQLGYTSVPKVASESEMKFIQQSARMQTNCQVSEKKIGEGKASLKDMKTFEIYKKAVNRLLRQKNLITFDILCYDVCKLFVQDHNCIRQYKMQYRYIFVDEFQDTDPEQIKFLDSFDTDTNFFFVGDALQNIYGFRGCSNATLKILSENDSWEHIKMYQNYRSTRQICQFANNHSRYASDSYRIQMEGQRDGDEVEIIEDSCASYDEPVDVHHLAQMIKMAEDRTEDMAIICRTNREVNVICEELKRKGLKYNSSKKNVEAIHLLQSAMDNDYMLNWLSTYLPTDTYADYVRQSANVENPDIQWFSKLYGKIKQISYRGKKIIDIRKISQNIRMTNYEKVMEILNIVEVQNIEIPEDIEYLSRLQMLDDIITRLEEAASTDLYVGTIHSVKGLEFGHVIVVGAYDRNFKIDSEENRNVYYVAITRAKNHLTVFMR